MFSKLFSPICSIIRYMFQAAACSVKFAYITVKGGSYNSSISVMLIVE